MRQMCSIILTREEAADLLMTGIFVRRVGVTPADRNLYVTVKHILDSESSVIRNVVTGNEMTVSWDNIEFS